MTPNDSLPRKRGRPRKSDHGDTAPVKALERGVQVIDWLARQGPQGLTDIALGTHIAMSTTYRLLLTLLQYQFVKLDQPTGRWSIGLKAYEVGQSFVRGRDVVSVARPKMDELMSLVGETVSLALVDDEEIIFVAQVETEASLRAFFPPGERGPLHASGCGKAVIATWTDSHIAEAMARHGMSRFTPGTLTTLPELMAAVEHTRQFGWSINDGEHTQGMRCVAAPIFDAAGHAIAAMSISGPAARVARSDLPRLGAQIRRIAFETTAGIGGDIRFFDKEPLVAGD
jgi:IclR family acetate operon transcriptional repressor